MYNSAENSQKNTIKKIASISPKIKKRVATRVNKAQNPHIYKSEKNFLLYARAYLVLRAGLSCLFY